MCQTLCCKWTMPSSGRGKRCSAIIAVDKANAVMCTVSEGAEFCPTTPDEPMRALYSSTSLREITAVVSQRVPGRLEATDCLARNRLTATLPYDDVSEGISPIGIVRRVSGRGVESAMLSSTIICLPSIVHRLAVLCH